jgi:hypothetical protein
MVVVTNPQRFGFTPVEVWFGVARATPRTVTVAGDLLRDATGKVVEFVAREGDTLITKPLT